MKTKVRGFEAVKKSKRVNKWLRGVILPTRGSKHAAGYDFISPKNITIEPYGRSKIIFTDVKSYMLGDEVLELHIRSSLGIKKGLILSNATGIIDSDYYSNPSNDGNIGIRLTNTTEDVVEIKAGERIMQGIFKKFLVADNGNDAEERMGGIGSTGK